MLMFSWVGWMQVMKSGMPTRCVPSLYGCSSASRYRKRVTLRDRCTRRLCANSRAEQGKIFEPPIKVFDLFSLTLFLIFFLFIVENTAHIALILPAISLPQLLMCWVHEK